MSKEILLTIEKFEQGEESKYQINSAKEIQFTLNSIAKNKSFVIIYFDNEQQFVKTILLGVNEQGIWLDIGPDEKANAALLKSYSTTFVTVHNGAKVQFECSQAVVAIYAAQPAFYFPLPHQILRLQRRDHFRLSTSGSGAFALRCVLPSKDAGSGKSTELPVMDISLGGLALKCLEADITLSEGELYPNCRIDLPEIGILVANVLIKNLFNVNTPLGVIRQAGCEFVELDSKMATMLQRYVDIMQSKMSGHR